MNSLLKKLILLPLVTGCIAFGYLYSQDFRPLIFKITEQKIAQMVASATQNKNDFKLLFCGTGSPNRTESRGQPCTALVANGKLFLFDAGEGAIAKLIEYDAPIGVLDTIFLTHLHSDHMSGVAEVLHNTALYGRRNQVETIGPPGTQKLISSFAMAYQDDLEERQRVLGAEKLDPGIVFSGAKDVLIEKKEIKPVYNQDGLIISAFQIDHPDWPHAYGYKIEFKGKVIIISGDTRASDGIRTYAKGADILIHEALNADIFEYIGRQMDIQGASMSGDRFERIAAAHTSTIELAEIAKKTEVRHLVITHLIPALPAIWMADQFFASGMSDIYDGDIIIARDGQWLDVKMF